MTGFAGQVAVVTGGANGMGREFVRQLVQEGARVATCDVDDAGLERLRAEHPTAQVARVDLGDASAREHFMTDVRAALGPVDLLVNNAGVGTAGPFVRVAGDDWTWIRSINLDAPIDLMRLVLPEMKARGSGRILNVASMAGVTISLGPASRAGSSGYYGFTNVPSVSVWFPLASIANTS